MIYHDQNNSFIIIKQLEESPQKIHTNYIIIYFKKTFDIIIVITFLGRVHSGMSVVKRMGMVETDKNDRPVDDVKILKGGVKI